MLLTRFKIKNNHLYLIIFLLSIVALTPFLIATLYLHPNVDDLFFSKTINELGTLKFTSHFYQVWSGRFFASFLIGSVKADPIQTGFYYTLMPILFIVLTWISIFKITQLFLKDEIGNVKSLIVSLFFTAFYITGLNEVFSALYWYCSSYYLLLNVFFLWFLYELFKFFIYNKKVKSFTFLKLFLLSFLLCGLSEVYIITLIVGTVIITLYHYFKHHKIRFDIILICVMAIIGSYLNIFSPGAITRMQMESGEKPQFIASAVRAAYDFTILQLSPLLYSGVIIISLILFFTGGNYLERNPKMKSFFNINPLISILSILFIFYLHHAMSIYGAGYVLQGRVINITNLLLYLSLFFITLNIVTFYNINFNGFKKSYTLTILLMIGLMMSFSKNARIVGKDIVYNLPQFDREMESRYKTILEAKSKGMDSVYIKRISVPLKSLDNNINFNPNRTYYNSQLYCRDATTFFEIDVKIVGDKYDNLD